MGRYAYIKLDAKDKDTTRQASLLDSIGDFSKIYVDRITPLAADGMSKSQLEKAILSLAKGDVLYTASADRVCSNIREFLILNDRIKSRGADFVCLDIGFDTRSSSSAQILRIIKTLGEIEWETMSERKKQGIQTARQRGRRIGRPPVNLPTGFRDICKEWVSGKINGVEAIRLSNMKSTSFYKKAAELGFVRNKNLS